MDIQMPIMDGYEASKLIREIDRDIPIVALSANAMLEDKKKSLSMGMNEHLNKPIEVEKLYKVLLRYINKKRDKLRVDGEDMKSSSLSIFKTINTEKGLKYLANSEKLYIKILKDFYVKYRECDCDTIGADEFKIFFHTVKGLSANIGAQTLHSIALKIDTIADKTLLKEFSQELKKVLDEIKEHILDKEQAEEKEKSSLSQEKRNELFVSLEKVLTTKQPKKCQPVIAEMDRYILDDKDKIIFDKVKYFMKKYKFKEAQALVKGLISG